MDLRGGDESTLVSLGLKPFLSATWWYQTICVPLGSLGGGASGWSVYICVSVCLCVCGGAEEGR